MIDAIRRALKDQRGTALILTLGFMVFLLAMAGFAIDIAYQFTATTEVERSMEAAALAGAGQLGFDNTVFPTARQWAANYAALNPYHNPRGSKITLNQNTANDPNGNIVLGIWDGSKNTFTPSVDGTQVNAVRCQWATAIPTIFLGMIGVTTLPVSAQAIAISAPPATLPPNSCVFPVGLSSCPFQNGGAFTSQGCGQQMKFITSNGKAGSTNTAAWVNLNGTGTPSASALKTEIGNIAAGTCDPTPPTVGQSLGTNNGMDNSVFQQLTQTFVTEFNQSVSSGTTYVVKNSQGNTTYSGPGWAMYVPILQTPCNANGTTGSITGSLQIIGWTRFVMTQAFNTTGSGKGCVVNNPYDTTTAPWCTNPPPELQGGNSRSFFGYYNCTLIQSPPVPTPVPRSALGTGLRLVKTQ